MGFGSFLKKATGAITAPFTAPTNLITSAFDGGDGSKNEVNSSQKNEVNTDITVDIVNDISFDELANAQIAENELNAKIFEYEKDFNQSLFEFDTQKIEFEKSAKIAEMSLQDIKEKEQNELKAIELKQNAQSLEQSKLNTNLTIFFATLGLILTVYQIKKGKK